MLKALANLIKTEALSVRWNSTDESDWAGGTGMALRMIENEVTLGNMSWTERWKVPLF